MYNPPCGHLRKSSGTRNERWENRHRFEHWYRDNSVYFITSSTRDHFPAFASEHAKQVFRDRFTHYANAHGFETWVVTLMNNHYHTLAYVARADGLGEMMRKIHGSVAKLVNDLLPERRKPFWRERGGRDYFDGCLRDATQLRRAHGYTVRQSVRHGVCADWRAYGHTRVFVSAEEGVELARARNAFLPEVPYARYQGKRGHAH
ncbi:MAG TPA: transposase [Tepidisphaeraceae bacterium]|nr:transposase [Tepidisphaeraceae bacterium]